MTRLLLMLLVLVAGVARAGEFHVLCYHDVAPALAPVANDRYAVSRDNLARHFAWLRDNGYRVVSVDDVMAAREGRRPLPDKAVLLSFDDGERSLYTEVYPLLRLFNYPALAALVTSWMEVPPGAIVEYGDETRPRDRFISWSEAREMQESGLVEFASQTHDLHYAAPASPQGAELPVAANRLWSADAGYEALTAYYQRVGADFAISRDILARRLGRAPRVLVWPYGAHSHVGWQAALRAGFRLSLTLDDTRAASADATHIGRVIVMDNADAADLAAALLPLPAPQALRTLPVRLDAVLDSDTATQARHLDALVERVRRLGVNTVYLQAVRDGNGDGLADSAFFPNRRLPVAADLFGYVARQLQLRAGVRVFAALPMTALRFPDELDGWRLPAGALNPAHAGVAAALRDLYDDLGRHAAVDGVLFSQAAGGNAAEAALQRELAALVRAHRPELRTAQRVADTSAGALAAASAAHDHVLLGAPACATRASCAALDRLVREIRGSGVRRDHVVVQVEGGDAAAIADSLQRLLEAGLPSFGYAPDDILRNQPDAARAGPAVSLSDYPWSP